MCRSQTTYWVAVMYVRPSLQKPDVEPFAIVMANESLVFVVGQYPDVWDKLSEVGKEVFNEIPDSINDRISEAWAGGLDVFDHLARSYEWNIFLGEPEEVRTYNPAVMFAFELFLEKVSGIEDARISQEMPISAKTFVNFIPAIEVAASAESPERPVLV